ncbi:MAG: hypothetical protein ABIG95_04330 [Candidatus Woesearchaeota archaeon]
MAISIAINLMTLQDYETLAGYPYGAGPTYLCYTFVQFFDIVANPLMGHYMPLFLEFGPQSGLLQRLIGTQLPAFLNVLIVCAVMAVIWLADLQRFCRKHRIACISTLALVILAIILRITFASHIGYYAQKEYIQYYTEKPVEQNLALNSKLRAFYPNNYYNAGKLIVFNVPFMLQLPQEVSTVNSISRNWYVPRMYPSSPRSVTSTYHNATIGLSFEGDSERKTQMHLEVGSFHKDTSLLIYQDDRLLGSYIIHTSPQNIYLELILHPGINVIKFASSNGCYTIYRVRPLSTDLRCVSFNFYNITIT